MKKKNAKSKIFEHDKLQQDCEIRYEEYSGKQSSSIYIHILLRRSRAPECGTMPISWSAWRKAAMSMTPVAPGISRGLSFLSSLGRPAGASFTAAEMRERCRLQPGHVCEAAVLG